MAEALCLVDSNILLRWVDAGGPGHAEISASIDLLLRRGFVICYASQNLGEFWNACTRPLAQNGFGLSPEDTAHKATLFEDRLRLLPDGILVHEEWRRLLVEYRVSGVQVHDTRLVAVMNVYGVNRLLTYNTKDFRRFTEIQVLHPADVATIE